MGLSATPKSQNVKSAKRGPTCPARRPLIQPMDCLGNENTSLLNALLTVGIHT